MYIFATIDLKTSIPLFLTLRSPNSQHSELGNLTRLNQTSVKLCLLTKDEVSLTWENRHQNYSVVSVCEALTGQSQSNTQILGILIYWSIMS